MLNVNVFYCFFTFFVAMILRFYSLCRGIGVVPFVPSWSVAVASVGPGLGGETDMTGATGFLEVFGRGRGFPKPCGIWRKDYGHGAALHVFAFFLHFDAWCSAATLRKFNST